MKEHAAAVVVKGIKRRRDEGELARRAKGDAHKLALTVRLRAETTVPVGWIEERLRLNALGYVNHLLYYQRKAEGK